MSRGAVLKKDRFVAGGDIYFGWRAWEVFADKSVPHVACFIGDRISQCFLASTADQHGKGAFDEIIDAKHRPDRVAVGVFSRLIAGDAMGEVGVGFRVGTETFISGIHIDSVVHEVEHSNTGRFGEVRLHFFPTNGTERKFKNALVTDIGFVDDKHTRLQEFAPAIAAMGERGFRFE